MRDRRGGIEKVISGDLGSLRARDGVEAARIVTGLVPGTQWVDPLLAGVQGSYSADDERQDLREFLGNDLSRVSAKSKVVRKKLHDLNNRSNAAVAEAGVSTGGFTVGALAGSVLGPLGSMGGGWIGSTVAQGLYGQVAATQDQDAIALTAQIREAQQKKQNVPAEVVFAALAASMPGRAGKRMENRLQALTGTRYFHEAVARGKTRQLQQMMREYDTDIRAYTHMPPDPENARKSVSRQYAELINSRRMDARGLLFDSARMSHVTQPVKAAVSSKPVTTGSRTASAGLDIRSIAHNLSALGVTVGDNGSVQVLPGKPGRGRTNS